jgi:hypothetical protein
MMVEHFADGGRPEDMRRQFEASVGLKKQMFYYSLAEAKRLGWLIASGEWRDRLYVLNPDASWATPSSTGTVEVEALQAEQLVEELQDEPDTLRASGNNGGVAVSSLVAIVNDRGASMRQRIRASTALLNYKVDHAVGERTKRFLESVCERDDVGLDYRIQAAETLRRAQGDPRIAPAVERPTTVRPVDTKAEEEERRLEALRKREHLARQSQLDAEEMKRDWERLAVSTRR